MATNTDAFAYSAGELASVSGGNWTALRTGGQTANVTAGGRVLGNSNFDSPYRYNASYSSAAIYSQIKCKALGANTEFAVIVNVNTDLDGNRDYHILEMTESGGTYTALLGKILNGSFTSLDTVAGLTLNVDDVVRIENDGAGTLIGLINGTPIAGLSAAADSTIDTYRGAGIMPSSSGVGELDEWEGGDMAAPSTVVKDIIGGFIPFAR